ncbi:MAG TPA: DUF3617 family protein [Methyloceanibacter sp.]|jgi:hypothetical protein|nr:DUF3617 family protein [Methyloceanibacter sp.]
MTVALCLAALGASAVVAATAEIPKRKPGYWEITTVAPVSGMTKIKVCVGATDDLVTPEDGDCTAPKTTPLNEGIIVDVTCTGKGGKQTISTTFTGDFQTRYHAILKTTFDPPIGAISHMGVNIDGKYLGPDCPDGDAAPKKN